GAVFEIDRRSEPVLAARRQHRLLALIGHVADRRAARARSARPDRIVAILAAEEIDRVAGLERRIRLADGSPRRCERRARIAVVAVGRDEILRRVSEHREKAGTQEEQKRRLWTSRKHW